MPATSTIASPRRRAGIVSASSEYAIGSSPPALIPMKKHATRFQWNAGIALHIAVPMKSVAASRIDARRPMRVAEPPPDQRADDRAEIAMNGKSATGQCPGAGCDGERRLYSLATPGRMNVKVNGFCVSTATASIRTSHQLVMCAA